MDAASTFGSNTMFVGSCLAAMDAARQRVDGDGRRWVDDGWTMVNDDV